MVNVLILDWFAVHFLAPISDGDDETVADARMDRMDSMTVCCLLVKLPAKACTSSLMVSGEGEFGRA